MRLSFSTLLFAVAAAARRIMVAGQANNKVIISYQTELSAVAHHIALDKGYYSHLGLDVEMVWYPSGAPQVKAAVEDAAWDMGGAGVVPNILGGPQGILGVGISMDQSATNQLVGNAEGVALWPPVSMAGIPIVLSPNSTGDYVVQACLKSQGFNIEDVEFIYEQQDGCIAALTPGSATTDGSASASGATAGGDESTSTNNNSNETTTTITQGRQGGGGAARANLGGLWAPNTYKFLDSVHGSDTICSGASVYATVTGGHMARKAFAEEHPDLVAKVLAGWLRSVTFINNDDNKEETLDYMAAFFAQNNVEIPRSSLEMDLRLVGLFGLQQQLDLMERRGEPPLSNYDIWTNEVGNFMLENGVISELTSPTTYIKDDYMKIVNNDPELKEWATGKLIEAEQVSSASGPFRYRVASLIGSVLAIIFMIVLQK